MAAMWETDSRAARAAEGYATLSATAPTAEDAIPGPDVNRPVAPARVHGRGAAYLAAAGGLLVAVAVWSASDAGVLGGSRPSGAAAHSTNSLWSVPWVDVGYVGDSACQAAERLFGASVCPASTTTATTSTTLTTKSTTVTTESISTTATKTTTTKSASSTSTSTATRTRTRTSTTSTRSKSTTTWSGTSSTSTTSTTTPHLLWPRPTKEFGTGRKLLVKGISYAPVPLKQPGAMLPNDDFMADGSATLWGPPGHGKGRRDLVVMKSLGANAVRLYGNDPALDHSGFMDEAEGVGLDVVAGLSDYPFVQMPGSCMQTGFDCFKQIKAQYTKNLQKGFLAKNGSYHNALRTVILMNEPDLKFEGGLRGTPGPPEHFCKALISAFDGVISAEQELGVSGPAPNFTVAFSFGRCDLCSKMGHLPGIGQMLELRRYMKNPGLLNYRARNDLWQAYQKRFINSFNTANPAIDLRPLFLDAYDGEFPRTPVFLGEYHSPNFADQRTDLSRIMEIAANQSTMLAGLSFFEFQKRYDKGGGEMSFGMFGLGEEGMAPTTIATKEYMAYCLEPVELPPQGAPKAAFDPKQCGVQQKDMDFVIEGAWATHIDHIPTPADCCARCQEEHRCEVWTWVKEAGLPGVPSQCWLKGGGEVRPTKKLGVVSSNMKTLKSSEGSKPKTPPKVDYLHAVLAEAFGGPGLEPAQLCPAPAPAPAAVAVAAEDVGTTRAPDSSVEGAGVGAPAAANATATKPGAGFTGNLRASATRSSTGPKLRPAHAAVVGAPATMAEGQELKPYASRQIMA